MTIHVLVSFWHINTFFLKPLQGNTQPASYSLPTGANVGGFSSCFSLPQDDDSHSYDLYPTILTLAHIRLQSFNTLRTFLVQPNSVSG